MAVVTDRDILNEIQYHTIEAPDQGATFPSNLWTPTEVLNYLNEAQRTQVRRTRGWVGRAPTTLAADTESLDLTSVAGFEDILQIVHVVLQVGTDFYEIPPASTLSADLTQPGWSTAAAAQSIPKAYDIVSNPTHTLRFIPVSSTGGTLWLHYIPRPWTLDRVGAGSGESLMVPAEFALGVKWDTLASMLGKPGRAHDPQRAAYCQQRGNEIVELTERLLDGF